MTQHNGTIHALRLGTQTNTTMLVFGLVD